jgi:hypothetical protein
VHYPKSPFAAEEVSAKLRRHQRTKDPDYGLLLNGWEAVAWDQRYREQFAQNPRSQEPFFVQSMQRWESMLKAASCVIIETTEWESGLSYGYRITVGR